MTTLYLFHHWIEASSTTDTVVLTFGGWWDADVTAAALPPATANIFKQSIDIFTSTVIQGII